MAVVLGNTYWLTTQLPCSNMSVTASSRFTVTTIEFDREALNQLCAAYPSAQFWDCKLEELHTLPDCIEIDRHSIVRMYENKEVAPREALGGCSLGTCVSSSTADQITVRIMDNFATHLPGYIFLNRNGPELSVHLDARCAGYGSRASVLCHPEEWYPAQFGKSTYRKLCGRCVERIPCRC